MNPHLKLFWTVLLSPCFFLCHGCHLHRFLRHSFHLCLFPEISYSTFHSCFSNYSQLPNPLSSFDSMWHLSLSQLLKSGIVPHILGWHVCRQFLPFPQFVIVLIFCLHRLCKSTSPGLASSLLCPIIVSAVCTVEFCPVC